MPRSRKVSKPKTKPSTTVRLKPANPFELIRWLARSQSDPRKAVAELVQNSLDAGATTIAIERRRLRGQPAVIVRDEGEGVLPEMNREDALRYLAQHIGHSRKLKLDPAERHRRVIAGKYGVGLLGFWAIGHRFELRSRVDGSDIWALELEEDSPKATIAKRPRRTDAPNTFTEAAVLGVHAAAVRPIGGRKLADYLAAELRGQLLRRDVTISITDRLARGRAQRHFIVTPERFLGQPLDLPGEFLVAEHNPIHVELYLARGADDAAIQVACAGTLVADSIAELSSLGLKRAPWTGRELTGILDFADFNIPPGSRRGVLPDAAASAFTKALSELAPLVEAELEDIDEQRSQELNQTVLRDLRRALKGFRKRLPHYLLPPVDGPLGNDGIALPGEPLSEDIEREARASSFEESEAPLPLLRGPLTVVQLRPKRLIVEPGAEASISARALDEYGNQLDAVITWELEDPILDLSGAENVVTVSAPPTVALGTEATITATATLDGITLSVHAIVRVAEKDREAAMGIPEPKLVSDADGRWRSRMRNDRWEVNDAHADYIAIHENHRSRVRYLITLLAKEIVGRNSGHPDADDLLEQMVEVLAHAERNLRGK